jgi:hypothetical protein
MSGSISGGGDLRGYFPGFVTVHTHIEPAGITSLREIEKFSPSIEVSARKKCWPGLMWKSVLSSAGGTVALVIPSMEKVIDQLEALMTLRVVSCEASGVHCALATPALPTRQRHNTGQTRVILSRALIIDLPSSAAVNTQAASWSATVIIGSR